MTEQELRIGIIKVVYSNISSYGKGYLEVNDKSEKIADQILALIKQAGYKSPEEVYNQTMQAKKSGWDDCERWHKAEGYVKLAEDQSLPRIPDRFKEHPNYNYVYNDGWRNGYAWLKNKVKANFVKCEPKEAK